MKNTKENNLNNLANKAGQKIGEFVSENKKHVDQLEENCDKFVKDKPVTSMLLAFGAGVLLTSLLKR